MSVGAVAATVVIAAAAPHGVAAVAPEILVVGFLLGLPHGAVDHLVPFWTATPGKLGNNPPADAATATVTASVPLDRRDGRRSGGSPPWRTLLRRTLLPRTWSCWMPHVLLGLLLAGYLAVAVTTWWGLREVGSLLLPILLVLSVLHFGLGDVMAGAAADGAGPRGRHGRCSGWRRRFATAAALVVVMCDVVSHGAFVVTGPLLFWPVQADPALTTIAPHLTPPRPSTREAFFIAALCATAVSTLIAARRRRWLAALEAPLLGALFAVAPPMVAFGVYFGAWHGLRHTARMIAVDPANGRDLAAGRLVQPIIRFVRQATLPSLVALTMIVIVYVIAYQHQGLVGPVVAGLLALTVPHLIIVAWMDIRTIRGRSRRLGRRDRRDRRDRVT
ncbi:beta-carotene 15,15'-dioxygenase, Brp/Blh family [Lapillicoccus jejuensis]|uniref:beta-carotene 15,15'-dioxygenase, Brp/Blh family n=1 Tax=Lapillicoccus jejuensis TaxID=402171 RepID=UPI001154E506|nr:beta-carotene 15,15'-dioxygenase, Brp/Blh family [Lapillicoccus jejuensis]